MTKKLVNTCSDTSTRVTSSTSSTACGSCCSSLKMYELFNRFNCYLHRDVPAEGLAILRIVFGLLMAIDVVNERGFHVADARWAQADICHFPIVPFVKPLQLNLIVIVYLSMFISCLCFSIGLKFKIASKLYLIGYVYIVALDKSYLNNHTYLFALITLILSTSEAHRIWSIDHWNASRINTRIPNWNYFLIRFQIFLLYFLAGLKKIDSDWLNGFSMRHLSDHWTFIPFRLVLSAKEADLVIIHWIGFAFDISVGFLFLLDTTRPLAYFLATIFNGMNSQLFSIGMFPYVMLAVHPIFSSYRWPSNLVNYFSNQEKQPDEQIRAKQSRSSKCTTSIIILYILIQCALPFSHPLTPGFNTWTNGFYGYSWDMMVHNWKTEHVRITIKDHDTNRLLFLDPDAWILSKRWVHHADMIKQFAECAKERLSNQHNMKNISLYVDAWVSLNNRFVQRIYDPNVDMIAVEWSPFTKPSFVYPLITDFNEYQSIIKENYEKYSYGNLLDSSTTTFFADFARSASFTYVHPDYGNSTRLKVLIGSLSVERDDKSMSRLLNEGDDIYLSAEHFYKLTTSNDDNYPSCYTFTYTNSTKIQHDNDEPKVEETLENVTIVDIIRSRIHDYSLPWRRAAQLTWNAFTSFCLDCNFASMQMF